LDLKVTEDPQLNPGQAPTVDLRPILASLYHDRFWILLCLLAGLVAGGVGWYLQGAMYHSVVTLSVSQPADQSVPVPVGNYRSLLENETVAIEAIKNAGLVHGSAPMSANWFLSRVLTIEEVRGTNLLRIHVRLADPVKAAAVANDVAQRSIALARKMHEDEGLSLRSRLESERDEALAKLRHADELALDFRRTNKVELLRTEVDAFIRQREALLDIQFELSAEKARAASATKERDARALKLTLERRIDQNPTLLEAARAQAGNDPSNLLGLGVKTEEFNTTYLELDAAIATSTARIAQLERQAKEILDASAAMRQAHTFEDLYSKESELAFLDADRALSRKVYEETALRYEQARLNVESRSAQMQVVDPARPSFDPVSWPLALWLTVGAVIGAALSLAVFVTGAVMRQYWLPTSGRSRA